MYEGATTCLDKFGKAFIILPIGVFSLANAETGISHFRHLAIHYAKQFPHIKLVTNSNMMRHERAIRDMIIDEDEPHYCDKGKMSNNLLYSIKQAMPVLSEYTYIVHDHCSRIKNDPNRPSPKARFYRRSSRHTGIPETADPPSRLQSKHLPALVVHLQHWLPPWKLRSQSERWWFQGLGTGPTLVCRDYKKKPSPKKPKKQSRANQDPKNSCRHMMSNRKNPKLTIPIHSTSSLRKISTTRHPKPPQISKTPRKAKTCRLETSHRPKRQQRSKEGESCDNL